MTIIINDKGERRKVTRKEVWSATCKDGRACERWDRNPATRSFVADDLAPPICDACLLARFGLADARRYDALDHLGIDPLLPEDDVILALRLAAVGGEDKEWVERQERIRASLRARMAGQQG